MSIKNKEGVEMAGNATVEPNGGLNAKEKAWYKLWQDWERADEWAAYDLGMLESPDEVVNWLYRIGQRCMVVNLRQYYLYGTRGAVLVNCAGHEEEHSEELCYGVRFERGLKTLESFYCFDVEKPVVCQVDPDLEGVSPGEGLSKTIAFAKVANSCGLTVRGEKNRLYIDIPVFYQGKPVLKFSCDFCVTDPAMLLVNEVEAFCRFAQMAGHILYSMQDGATRERLREERVKVGALKSDSDLCAYIENDLPGFFKCKMARFFELRRDGVSGENAVTVLTQMMQDKKARVPQARYIYGKEANPYLVPLAARTKKTLSFDDIHNKELREQVCREYSLDVDWRDEVFDNWGGVESVVMIPTLSPASEEVLGVLVLAGKNPPGDGRCDLAYFNWLDQRLAEWVASDCLAPKIEALRNTSRSLGILTVFH